jgi:arylsulfatase A-like enzyme
MITVALVAVLLAAAVWHGGGRSPFSRRATAQNLVIIVVDTLRRDHLECYGYDRQTAPNICRFASAGAVFDGVSPSSWTKPAAASILTGLHPLCHQAIERNDKLPAAARTLAEVLREAGHSTLAISGNGWVSEQFGFDQGFDELVQVRQSETGARPTAEQINVELFAHLQELEPPFFLYLHYIDPHTPYDPPYDWTQAPLNERLKERAPINGADLRSKIFTRRDPQLLRDAIDLYDGEIRFVDDQIGELWSRLTDLGLTTQTLLVITSDHGEEFEDHGRAGHGQNLYREVVEVPWIMYASQVVPPGNHSGSASLMDIVPTTLDLLGLGNEVDGLAHVDGRNLAPRIGAVQYVNSRNGDGSPLPAPEPMSYLLHLDLDGIASLALVDRNDKIVLARNPYRQQLFDLGSDPLEQESLIRRGSMPDEFPSLARQLANGYNELLLHALDRETVEDAGVETRALRALGYITPSAESLKPRLIPPRVAPADPTPGGLLGWEMPGSFSSCIPSFSDPIDPQLLAGWVSVDRSGRGRWTRRNSTLALKVPAVATEGDLELRLDGLQEAGRPVRISVYLNNQILIENRSIADAEWRLRLPVAREVDPAGPPAIVRITVVADRAADTSRAGPGPRGVLVTSACLVPAGDGSQPG